MKKLLSSLICAFLLSSLFAITANANVSRPVNGRVYVNVGEIVDGDCFLDNRQTGEKLGDSSDRTYLFFRVNQSTWLDFPWGGTIWPSSTQESFVEQKIKERNPGWTRDQTTTVWPRGSSGSQPPENTTWVSYRWRELKSNEFLLLNSGIIYWNFSSQNTTSSSSINISRTTTINTTATVWVYTTTSGQISYNNPGYKLITLTPPTTTTDPCQDNQYTETLLYAGQRVTGWMWIYDSSRSEWIQQWDSHCENPLFFVNQSGTTIKIRYEKNGVSKKKVTIYNAEYPTNENLRIQYGTELGIDWRLITVKYFFQYF